VSERRPSDDDYTAVQRHPDDPFGDGPASEVDHELLQALKASLGVRSAPLPTEAASAPDLLVEVEGLRTENAILSKRLIVVNEAADLCGVVEAQRDALADALLALVISRNVAKPGTTQPGDPSPTDWAAAAEALRKAGRLPQ
jgi:hypothetical protein